MSTPSVYLVPNPVPEEQTYWEPATTSAAIYAQISAHNYREIKKGEIK